jgi:hypothetical protein
MRILGAAANAVLGRPILARASNMGVNSIGRSGANLLLKHGVGEACTHGECRLVAHRGVVVHKAKNELDGRSGKHEPESGGQVVAAGAGSSLFSSNQRADFHSGGLRH